jgi:hypothetical protein
VKYACCPYAFVAGARATLLNLMNIRLEGVMLVHAYTQTDGRTDREILIGAQQGSGGDKECILQDKKRV